MRLNKYVFICIILVNLISLLSSVFLATFRVSCLVVLTYVRLISIVWFLILVLIELIVLKLVVPLLCFVSVSGITLSLGLLSINTLFLGLVLKPSTKVANVCAKVVWLRNLLLELSCLLSHTAVVFHDNVVSCTSLLTRFSTNEPNMWQ